HQACTNFNRSITQPFRGLGLQLHDRCSLQMASQGLESILNDLWSRLTMVLRRFVLQGDSKRSTRRLLRRAPPWRRYMRTHFVPLVTAPILGDFFLPPTRFEK